MKALRLSGFCICVGFVAYSQVAPPNLEANALATNYVVVERGPHHKVVQYQVVATNVLGYTRTNSYREIQTGMHRKTAKATGSKRARK